MTTDIVCVADGDRISLGVALNILVARKSSPNARFLVALPEGADFGSAVAEDVITTFAHQIIRIPAPTTVLDGKLYRIENKINALSVCGIKRAILVDSDILFIRPLPESFLIRESPAAVPEHGKHEFPWDRLYPLVGLKRPEIEILLGSGEICDPWFNAGFVACPDAEQLGHVWRMMADFVFRCPWVPERWPYLDQISLPLAMAQLSPGRTVQHSNVLPARFNQNVFNWSEDQSYVRNGFVLHHHNKVRLIERYFPLLIMWIRDGYPIVDKVVDELRRFDEDE